MAPILITGGTGHLGSHVIPRLIASHTPVRILSRSPHVNSADVEYVVGDTVSGAGLERALVGMDTVLHLAGGAKGDDVAAFHVAAAARTAGVAHLVAISVIGADRMPMGFFRAKAGAESAIADSGVPWTVLRAAQFHDFVMRTVGMLAKMPVVPVPSGLRFEPVDADEVAAELIRLTLGAPRGRVPDLAGPQVLTVEEILDPLIRAKARHRPRFGCRIPGRTGRAYRAGDNLANASARRGYRTWAQFVADVTDAANRER